MSARHIRRCDVGCKAFSDNLTLLLHRPGTSSIRPHQNLNSGRTSALTISRMSALILKNQIRRDPIHAKNGSWNGHPTPDVTAAPLTTIRMSLMDQKSASMQEHQSLLMEGQKLGAVCLFSFYS